MVIDSKEDSERTRTMLLSPNAMADAAYEAGVAHRRRIDTDWMGSSSDNHGLTDVVAEFLDQDSSQHIKNKRRKLSEARSGDDDQNQIKSQTMEQRLDAIWTCSTHVGNDNGYDNNHDNGDADCDTDDDEFIEKRQVALAQTKQLVFYQLEHTIQAGLDVFHQNDELNRQLSQTKEFCESRGREIQRLRAAEEDSRASLSNLLRAVEASKTSARDASRTAHIEARLRGEVSSLRSEKDKARGEYAESKRRVVFLEEEVRLLKSRVVKLTQEKVRVERDSRAALSLARSMDSHAASDVDYYKRKVSDLNDHLHSKNAVISELRHQVNEYKKQMERSISQNRLAHIRADERHGREK